MEQDKDIALQDIAEKALTDSVVRFEIERGIPSLASRPQWDLMKIIPNHGSGFFIDKHLIVTNLHVIIGATSVKIILSRQEESFQIESVEAYDTKNDLILLTVDCEGVPLILGDSDTLQDGDEICAVGYPADSTRIEHGTVEDLWKKPSGDQIRLSTNSSRGGSGSAILNSIGEVIGVKSSAEIDNSGNVICGYAIPSNIVKALQQNRTESVPFEEWCDLPQVRYLAELVAAERFRKDANYKEAIAHYDIAIELFPDKKKVIMRRADVKAELAFFNEAMTDNIFLHKLDFVPFRFSNLRESMSWRWRMLKLYGLRFLLNLSVSVTGRQFWLRGNAISNFRMAKKAINEGKLRDARSFCQNAISLYSEAIDLKEETGGIYSRRAWVRFLLGQIESEQGNTSEAAYCYRRAIDDIDAALKFNPKQSRVRADYYDTRGVARAALGQHKEAIEDFNECIRLKPKKALYYHGRGVSNEALGQHEAAEADFAKAKILDPDLK
ncbi:hypothetical protein F4X73_03975 [Candidatus Poribacteria bacterium]|nr:hypothetical protein [Candidatus Poribacteria bacterium]